MKLKNKKSTRVCARESCKNVSSKRSQVTIFIIIAIILVAVIAGYFLLKGKIFLTGMPSKFQPIENYFLDCIKQTATDGKEILGERGGRIYLSAFEPGNSYAPFSNMLDFQGNSVPYWYYVSSSSEIKEQIPSKIEMEQELGKYIEENFKCDFSDFEMQGYEIEYSELKVTAKINELSIDIQANSELNVVKESESGRQTSHKTNIESKLGKMYDEAVDIYDYEKKNMFLENYAVDALRLYAPVDGVEMTCAPKYWMPEKVISDIDNALEANINAIKTKGSYYSKANKYFVTNIETDDAVNFIYSKSWARRIEIWPVESGMMSAEPVGNQEGLGILGFCYVPYHFVYDVYIPVLMQIYDSREMFQFPVSVIIDKNKARKALEGEAVSSEMELCRYKNTEMNIYTYDNNLEPVEADISYKCFDTECDIGKTEIIGNNAVLSEKFPQCVNGFIIATAEGYAEKKQMISTNSEGISDIILDKLYDVEVEIENADGEYGILYFTGEHSASLAWPEQKTVKLSEGEYNITLYLYRNSSLIFPATSQQKCVDVAKPGILGIFGGTEEQCFNIDMPSQTITNVLSGGGKTSDYFTIERLEKGKIKINPEKLKIPGSLDDLSRNYEEFELKRIYIEG